MNELYISMYHYTRDLKHSRYPEIKGLDISLFREQIEFMKHNFNIVTMEQVIDAVEGGGVNRSFHQRHCFLPLMMDTLIIIHMHFLFWRSSVCREASLFPERPLPHISFWM